MESGFFFIRGWSEGYFGGDETEYVREEIRDTDNKWRSVSGEITIDDSTMICMSHLSSGVESTTPLIKTFIFVIFAFGDRDV